MKLHKGDAITAKGHTWMVWSTNSRKRAGRPIELRRKASGYNGVSVYATYTNVDELVAAGAVKVEVRDGC